MATPHPSPSVRSMASIFMLVFALATAAPLLANPQTYRLYPSMSAYIDNPGGEDFDITIDIRDINIYANGPREVLLKIYAPDGGLIAREIVPDDGIEEGLFKERVAGWDHRLFYDAHQRLRGDVPGIHTSSLSNPARLKMYPKRTFKYPIKQRGQGIYRIVLAGTVDHYATVNVGNGLKYGVAGNQNWIYGIGGQLSESYIYIPKDSTGLSLALSEFDAPHTRRFTLTAPDGKVLFDNVAKGGFSHFQAWNGNGVNISKEEWEHITSFPKSYEGKLLKLTVSEGPNDFAVMMALKQPFEGVFKDFVGVGSQAVFAPDPQTAMALRGGTIERDDLLFWHPFQVRFYEWLKNNPMDDSEATKAVHKELEILFNRFRLVGVGDIRSSSNWNNLAYSFGYAGCKIWRKSWVLMNRKDVPEQAKDLIREALVACGDAYSFANGIDRVNGNSYASINVALWYCQAATGDPIHKQRFETFWKRWSTDEGWGAGVGLSPSGAHQETFAHAYHYMSYLMNHWIVGGIPMYVEEQKGIIGDAVGDPRWENTLKRIRNLYSYIYCREPISPEERKNLTQNIEMYKMVVASPWSSRTDSFPINRASKTWDYGDTRWKGDPGPDFTTSVNDGNEWFAARRKNYYALTYHGRITPAWVKNSMAGQVGFSGGLICQLTVPGKGVVLASNLDGWYGVNMHPANWRNFHIHSVVGEMWDGRPLVTGMSEHDNARLNGNTVESSAEVRESHVRVKRRYVYNNDHIDCHVSLAESDYTQLMSLWSQQRKWSEVRLAYEMIPFLHYKMMPSLSRGKQPSPRLCAVNALDANGKSLGPLTETLVTAATIDVNRGDFGVRIELPKPMRVKRGSNNTVMIQLTNKESKAEDVSLDYRLVPYRK